MAIALNVALPDQLTLGPWWLLPGVEGVLLAVLIIVTPSRAVDHETARRRIALAVIAFVSTVNIVFLAGLVHTLINGGGVRGHTLIVSGGELWLTNVLLFSVWYWEMDRGGPVNRFENAPHTYPDLMFPQMDDPQLAPKGWRPGFGDYLYTSLTNAMAFSPTDTMPLTPTAKTAMGIQSVAALLTVGLVIARAVNILG